MPLKKVSYKDEDGKWKVSLIPEEESEVNAWKGIPVGPPDLKELNLPAEVEVRLNNELYHRGILTITDALKRRPDILGAIQSTLKVDVERVVELYAGKDYRVAKSESQPVTTQPTVRRSEPRRRR